MGMNETIQQQTPQQGEIILYQPDETVRLEVRLANDNVWLNRQQMAELFDRDVKTIGKHIGNALQEELRKVPTVAKFAIVQIEGNRQVNRTIEFYSLDMVISVGYRVKSEKGIEFRIWANQVLKDYLLRGYSINQQMRQLEQKIDSQQTDIHDIKQVLTTHQEKIDFFVRTNQPPVEGIFYDGQIFDAYRFVSDLVRKARHSITLIDNYVDDTVLTMLDKRADGVTATIYTQHVSEQLQLDLDRHNAQYAPIIVEHFNRAHDRFLLIDDEVYHIGASLKDLGRRWFAFTLMHDLTAEELVHKIRETGDSGMTPPSA